MKKKIYLTICILLIIVISILIINNKKHNNEDLPKSIDNLISYDVLDDYNLIEELYYHDSDDSRDENIVVERSYEKDNDQGRFTVSIYSYKKKEVIVESDNLIDEDIFINNLVKTNKISIDNHEFITGFSGQDDFDDVIGRAIVKDGDYVLLFSMRNFDNHLTDEQYNDFIKMIETIKFK